MKTLLNFKNMIFLLLASAGVTGLQSCVVYQPYSRQQVPVKDIVQMSRDGLSSKAIISDLRQSHSVYTLRANELAKLREQGVQDSVINYMEKTHFDAIRYNQRMYDSYYAWPGYGWYGGFGWPYDYWGWGPTVIISEHRSFGGGYHGGFHGGYHRGFRR